MNKIEILQEYLQRLYEVYDEFQMEYRRCHKRSRYHNIEPIAEYYLRWRNKMQNEISRIEMILLKNLPKPNFYKENVELPVEKYQLHNVGNSNYLVLVY